MRLLILLILNTDIICFGNFNVDPNRGRFWGRVNEFFASYNFRLVDSILSMTLVHQCSS